MTQNPVPKHFCLTPSIEGSFHGTTLMLSTNFGQQPFRSLTNQVLHRLADARAEFQGNPDSHPRKWSRYPAAASVEYTEDGRLVIYRSELSSSLQGVIR